MSRELNPMQVWSQVPLANRTITVSDKTGFSLTAGSYAIHASNNQRGIINISDTISFNTAAISAVTLARALCGFGGPWTNEASIVNALARIFLSTTTVVRAERGGTTNSSQPQYEIEETF
jgi:hypothetical protein